MVTLIRVVGRVLAYLFFGILIITSWRLINTDADAEATPAVQTLH